MPGPGLSDRGPGMASSRHQHAMFVSGCSCRVALGIGEKAKRLRMDWQRICVYADNVHEGSVGENGE